MTPVAVVDVHEDVVIVQLSRLSDRVTLTVDDRSLGYDGETAHAVLNPEAARQLGLALIAFSLEAERER